MQDKYDIIGHLPTDPLNATVKDLSNKEVVSVATTSTQHLQLFKPLTEVRKVSQFLHHVTHGNHEAVEAMLLTGDISLFYKKGQVTDCSGRAFANISGFEYALWALDKHMWTRIFECVPKTEEGLGVWRLLKGQYDNLVQKGITYTLNGKIITEPHFDLANTLIKEMQTQVDSANATGAKDLKAIDKQWREGVGGAQQLLPMHVVFEYCSNEPFYPVPKFISQPKSSKQFYNWATDKDENWFRSDSELGSEVAIYKVAGARAGEVWEAAGGGMPMTGCRRDLDAMKALCEVRKMDLINLKSQLEDRASLDNRHQVVPM